MINDDILPAYSFVRTFNIELGRMLLIDHKLNIFLYFQLPMSLIQLRLFMMKFRIKNSIRMKCISTIRMFIRSLMLKILLD